MTNRTHYLYLTLVMLVLSIPFAKAQSASPAPPPMTLRTAVEYALAHHPILRADAAQSDAADENLNLARAGLIPRGYIGLQETRATGNVVPGSMFPMTGIPNVSGPPTDRLFDSGVWGSGAGLSLWWDVAHLTQQMRMVDAALADRSGAEASYAAGRLEVAFAAADAFAIAVEAADQRKAARASADRARIVQRTVDALVRSDLRPGADGARAAAEVALADTQLIHAEQQVDLTRARLAEALGVAGQPIDTLPRRLAEEPPAASEPVRVARSNPLVVAADQVAKAAAERKRAAVLDYIPRVEIVAALGGRASGLFPGGARLGFAQGAVPDTPNWASGVNITIPILEYSEIRARANLADANARVAAARLDTIKQQVQTQLDSAIAVLRSAYRAADEAQISLESSRAALSQAQARYKAGLYGIDPVAEALRLQAEAEAEDAVARTDVWRARMLVDRAVGDIGPLLEEASEASGGH